MTPVTRITRRQFLYTTAAATLTTRTFAQPPSRLLLVGTQTQTGPSKGIYAYSFHERTLTPQGLATEADNPTFLALSADKRTILVANELNTYEGKDSGAVSTYSLDRATNRLTKINEVPSRGAGPCHVAFDHTGRSAFAANYAGGSAASFSVTLDGHLSPAVSFFQYTGSGPDAARQKSPHAHRVTVSPDNRFLLVNDLGLDCIHIYRLDPGTAQLSPSEPAAWHSTPGSGPRALQFHPNGRVAYCVTEMASAVVVLRWNAKSGTLETIQQVPMRPPDFQGTTGASDIVLDPHARFAYAADRFDDIIVTFAISPSDGTLTLLDRIPCGGKVPRHLALDPTGETLLVANQASDNIATFARDTQTGQLLPSRTYPISRPQCLLFP
jgi:6-phosphogluconolactonase